MPMRAPVLLFASLALAAACGPPAGAQGGLSNAPGANKPWGPEERGEDAISNGPGSCPQTPEGKDPLPGRLNPCPGQAVERGHKLKPAGSASPAPSSHP